MKRIIAVTVSLCMIITGAFASAPEIAKIVPNADIEASAASYPALKKINYKATGDQRKDIIGFANTQIGYRESGNNRSYFGAWYGMNGQPWCAMFVCWCAAKAGVSKSVIPRLACAERSWAKKQKIYYKSKHWGGSYTPKSGDLIYFSWSVRDYADHIGMVTGTGTVNGVKYVYTVEGNKSDKVKTGSYPLNSRYVLGYASPKYGTKGATKKTTTAAPKYTIAYNANGGKNAPGKQIKAKGKAIKLSTSKPTRVGFSFLGWAENANTTTVKYKPGAQYTADKGITLFAVWKDNTYQVKITKDGGLPKRAAPGTDKAQKGTLAKGSSVTIVETKNGWGKLADGCWIMLKFTQKIAKPTTTTKATTRTTTKATATNSLGTYQTTGNLYKRSGPGKGYQEKGVLKKGARVTVVEIKNGWARMADGTWSSMKYLKKVAGPTTKATTRSTTKATTKTTTKTTTNSTTRSLGTYQTTGDLFKRSGPGKNYQEKGVLKKGARVTVVEIKNGWARMTDGTWSSMKYLKKVADPATNATTKATSKVTTTTTNNNREVTVIVDAKTGLHMRTGPGKSNTSKGKLQDKTQVTVKAVSNGWGQMKSNNLWIMLKYTNIVSGYKVKVTINTLHMRKGAGKQYASIGYIKPGTYDIAKLNEDGTWGKLKTNGMWIMLRYTTRI